MADHGYDIADYRRVDPRFGTLNDFDAVVDTAHERGLRVLIDLVANHTSSEHPWFRSARQSRASDYRDYYIWRDPAPDGGPPNNWVSAFGGPAWTLDDATGQYWCHLCLPEQPDLNWANPAVADEFDEILRFWLDRGVDGFRIDVAHFPGQDTRTSRTTRRRPPTQPAACHSGYPTGNQNDKLRCAADGFRGLDSRQRAGPGGIRKSARAAVTSAGLSSIEK